MSNRSWVPEVAHPLMAVVLTRKLALLKSFWAHVWPPQADSDEELPRV